MREDCAEEGCNNEQEEDANGITPVLDQAMSGAPLGRRARGVRRRGRKLWLVHPSKTPRNPARN
jgi:hypothetical protein